MKSELILLSTNAQDVQLAQQVAATCGLELRQHSKPAEVAPTAKPALVLAQVGSTQDCEDVAKAFGDRVSRNNLHFLCAPDQLRSFDPFAGQPRSGSLIIRRDFTADNRVQLARIWHASLGSGPFGLASLMGEGAELQTFELNQSMQRGFAASSVTEYLSELGCQRRIAATIANCVDELLMNAMFDAPIDAQGGQLFESTPRSTDLKLQGKFMVELHVASTKTHIGVTVADQVGSLNRDRALQHFSKGYNGLQNELREGSAAGAGLGLALVYRSAGSILFANRPGVRTEATVFFERAEQVRSFKQQTQFVMTWGAD